MIAMKNVRNILLACGIGLSLFAIAGCSKKDPADLVRERALERWDLLAGRHAIKAYDYLSPGYRTTHTLEQYVAFIATARLQWKSAKIESVQCDEDACTAHLIVTSAIPGSLLRVPKDIEHSGPVTERWVRSDGQWYFLPDSQIKAESLSEQVKAEVGQPSVPAAEAPASTQPGPETNPEKAKQNN
ncbi:MAG: hypothetical protein J0I77_09170 [Rudaea sp.]|uniref:hypothetical protein n=1 Tax=unclassified Rudaea TaxID=2627037 RepID=UPI0010FA06E9|nr:MULTISPECIES: hypothetical protein [unclassified Rudaea]MBN8885876.1 hypothetical protein [Rudaea sp.]MBR0345699.1 hypothetical protein [Rudaea sp.]